MAFPRYPELPPELRLKIIEETLDSFSSIGQWVRMSAFACINHEWNRVVELRLFKNIVLCAPRWDDAWTSIAIKQQLIDFGAICGKRSGRLSRILLIVYDDDQKPSDNHPQLQFLSQLFDLMKDWNCHNREQQGLIELRLDFRFMTRHLSWGPDYPYDLCKFPQVHVIGSIYEPRAGCYGVRLHPGIMADLCQRLPNVHRVSLTLPSRPNEYVSTEDFTRKCAAHNKRLSLIHWQRLDVLLIVLDAMESLRIHKPGLTHLELKIDFTEIGRRRFSATLPPIIQRLNDSPSPWSDRLVRLELEHNIVPQEFLRDASMIVWPNLNAIKLVGIVGVERQDEDDETQLDEDDGTQLGEDDLNAVADESGSKIIEALITALPSMPKATKFQIKMIFKTLNKAFKISIHLGNLARTEKAVKILPCVDSFVPNANNGVAKGYGIYLPGDTAIQLQDAVRAHRRQDLEVFACGEDGYYDHRKSYRSCAQWNRRTENWDPVFKNDMDIFIYEMGQYWEAVDQMDGWS